MNLFSWWEKAGARGGVDDFLRNTPEQQAGQSAKPAPSDDHQIDLMCLAIIDNPHCWVAVVDDGLDVRCALLFCQVTRLVDDRVSDAAQHVGFGYPQVLHVLEFFQVWRNAIASEMAHDVEEKDLCSVLRCDLGAIRNCALGMSGAIDGNKDFSEHG